MSRRERINFGDRKGALGELMRLRGAEAVKAAQKRETVREIGKENVAELMRKRGVDDPEDLE